MTKEVTRSGLMERQSMLALCGASYVNFEEADSRVSI